MEICDIQLENEKDVIITFCSLENSKDIMTINISIYDAWQIAHFCTEKLSYRAQLKNNKKQISPNRFNENSNLSPDVR